MELHLYCDTKGTLTPDGCYVIGCLALFDQEAIQQLEAGMNTADAPAELYAALLRHHRLAIVVDPSRADPAVFTDQEQEHELLCSCLFRGIRMFMRMLQEECFLANGDIEKMHLYAYNTSFIALAPEIINSAYGLLGSVAAENCTVDLTLCTPASATLLRGAAAIADHAYDMEKAGDSTAEFRLYFTYQPSSVI